MRRSTLFVLLIFIISTVIFAFDFETALKEAVQNYLVSHHGDSITITSFEIKFSFENADSFDILSHFVSSDNVRFLVRLSKDGSFLRYGQILAKVAVYRKVVVAKRIIKSGQIIRPEDLKIVEMNVFGKKGKFVENIDEIVGKISKKMFREDEPIDLFYVQYPPDVKAGEVLMAVAEIGGVVVTAMVRVMQDARFGEVVKARNLSTGFLIQGILGRDYKIYVSGS